MVFYEICDGYWLWFFEGITGLSTGVISISYIVLCFLLLVPVWRRGSYINNTGVRLAVHAALIAIAISPGIMINPEGCFWLTFPMLFTLTAILVDLIMTGSLNVVINVLPFMLGLIILSLVPFTVIWFFARVFLSKNFMRG